MPYLDQTGLTTLWNKIKANFGATVSKSSTASTVTIDLKNKATTPASLSSVSIAGPSSSAAGVVPGGGTNGQILTWDSSGSGGAKWAAAPDTGVTKVVAGSNVTIDPSTGTGEVTVNATDTTYSDATTSTHGLMSASDKVKLNGIATGAEVNVQADWDETDTTSDAYIQNKPTIPEGAKLYTTTGQNTDGAMTQKATTDELNLRAPIASPTLTGTPKAPTAAAGTNTTQIATTAFVETEITTAMTGAAKYQGTIASESALTALTNYKQGWYWVASASFASASKGITIEAGNFIFANADGSTYAAAKFDVVQADIEAIPDSVIDALS